MPVVLHAVAELPQFLRDVRAVGLSEDEHRAIVDSIAADPLQGDEIRGSGGVRKVRFARRGDCRLQGANDRDRATGEGDRDEEAG